MRYGGELQMSIQCFWTLTEASLLVCNSSKQQRAVARPSPMFAWASPLPPINLQQKILVHPLITTANT